MALNSKKITPIALAVIKSCLSGGISHLYSQLVSQIPLNIKPVETFWVDLKFVSLRMVFSVCALINLLFDINISLT